MSWTGLADVLAAVCFLASAGLALVAAIGVLRFPDVLTRMHAATKPQVLGLLLGLLGLALVLRDPGVVGLLLLVAFFQMATTPIASHMVGRAAFRAHEVRKEQLVVDELTPVIDEQEPRGAP